MFFVLTLRFFFSLFLFLINFSHTFRYYFSAFYLLLTSQKKKKKLSILITPTPPPIPYVSLNLFVPIHTSSDPLTPVDQYRSVLQIRHIDRHPSPLGRSDGRFSPADEELRRRVLTTRHKVPRLHGTRRKTGVLSSSVAPS